MARLNLTPARPVTSSGFSAPGSVTLAAGGVTIATTVPGTADPAVNEKQTVTVLPGSSGTFTLTFDGQTTSAIADDATGAQVKAALVALSNIGANDVDVVRTGSTTLVHTVEFKGALAATNVAQMTANTSGLLLGVTVEQPRNSSRLALRVNNTHASSKTGHVLENVAGKTARNKTFDMVVPAGASRVVSQLDGNRFMQSNGDVHLTFPLDMTGTVEAWIV